MTVFAVAGLFAGAAFACGFAVWAYFGHYWRLWRRLNRR